MVVAVAVAVTVAASAMMIRAGGCFWRSAERRGAGGGASKGAFDAARARRENASCWEAAVASGGVEDGSFNVVLGAFRTPREAPRSVLEVWLARSRGEMVMAAEARARTATPLTHADLWETPCTTRGPEIACQPCATRWM